MLLARRAAGRREKKRRPRKRRGGREKDRHSVSVLNAKQYQCIGIHIVVCT